MSLNATEVGQVVSSLHATITRSKIMEVISERNPGRITLIVRADRVNHYLRLALEPQATRFGRIKDKPKAAPVPHPFVMLLRRELIGKRIIQISQINSDRVVFFVCAYKEMTVTLVFELTAQNANVYLVNQNNVIQGSFWGNRPGKRVLVAGNPYHPPVAPGIDLPPSRFEREDTLERDIDNFYRKQIAEQDGFDKRQLVERMIKAAQKKTNRLISKLERDLSHAETGETMQRHGHVLKMHLSKIRKGASVLEGRDFDNRPVTISLDPKLSPVANMEKKFNKAKRLIRAVSKIEERLLTAMSEAEDLASILPSLPQADGIELDRIKTKLTRRYPYLLRIENRKRTTARLPYKEYILCQNKTARVGRNAQDNDTLTLRYSKPNDLWLHVRQETGSHVIVPMGRNEDPTPELLVDAAHLAAYFSRCKNDTDVEVIYTPRRYVQKPKGAAAGSVRLLREKTIFLKVEPARLKQIFYRSKSSM